MALNSMDVVNEFLYLAQCDGELLTHLKVQKLLYFAQGWYLAYLDDPLFNDSIQAWKFGPVVENVYKHLKKYGSGAVSLDRVQPLPEKYNDVKEFLNYVWNTYKRFTAVQLSDMSHIKGGPWDQANKAHAYEEIPLSRIKNYFTSLIPEEPINA